MKNLKTVVRISVALLLTVGLSNSAFAKNISFGPLPPPPVEDGGFLKFGPLPPPPVEDFTF